MLCQFSRLGCSETVSFHFQCLRTFIRVTQPPRCEKAQVASRKGRMERYWGHHTTVLAKLICKLRTNTNLPAMWVGHLRSGPSSLSEAAPDDMQGVETSHPPKQLWIPDPQNCEQTFWCSLHATINNYNKGWKRKQETNDRGSCSNLGDW